MTALALLAALTFFVPSSAVADLAARGLFDIEIAPGAPNTTFDGQIRFRPGEQTIVDGVSVNLAEEVGTMAFAGDAVIDLEAERVGFVLSADSDGEFTFDASGTATCDSPTCFNERATLAGRLTFIDDPDDVLPDDGIYTFDGTAAVGVDGAAENGRFAINAFRATETPAGRDVEVTSGPQAFWDTDADKGRTFEASARFESVTVAGSTDFVAFSKLPNAFPAGMTANSNVSVFVDASTDAMFSGNVSVCLGYKDENQDDIVDGTPNNLSALRLRVLHAATDEDPFTDVTFGRPTAGFACGNVTALGRLALGVGPPDGGSTTTTIGGTSTTTSLGAGVTTTSSTIPTVSTTTLPPGPTTTSTSVPPGETSTTSTTSSTGESTTTSTTLLPVTTSTVLAASTTTTTTPAASTTSSTTPPRRSTTTTVASRGSTTTSTLPVCTSALECLGVAIAGPICPGETVNAKLSTLILKKLARAQTALLAARSANSATKAARLVKKARRQVDKVAKKATVFVSKPKAAISAGCRDRIIAATGLVTQQIDANRI